jgi:plasmid maintenance system antidote protein VapI
MTSDDLRAWQAHMGYIYDTAAAALGMSRRAYAEMINGRTPIDRRTALACAALSAGLGEWTRPASLD